MKKVKVKMDKELNDEANEQNEEKLSEPETGIREATEYHYAKYYPKEAIAAGELAFIYGANKYHDRNWEKGLPWQAMIDSLKRHVDDLEMRRDFDDGPGGSGLPTIAMIGASSAMLIASVMREIGEDNRLVAAPDTAWYPKDCSLWIKENLEAIDDDE